jgi:outer membrane lipoprotein SlyB
MKKIYQPFTALLCVSALFASGCTPNIGGHDYSVADSGSFSQVFNGTITAMKKVKIAGKSPEDQNQPGVGAGVGALAGGVGLGTTLGQGRGSIAAAGAGALLGGVLGHYAEKELTSQTGIAYTIRLDDKRTVSVAQGMEPQMTVGQRVQVIVGKKRTRVVPL